MTSRKSAIKNFSGAFIANMLTSLISILVVLIVPKFVSVSEYSYWQLYILYASFVGVLHLGLADGVYLREGGKRYKDLNKQILSSQFWLLCVFEIFMASLFFLYALFFVDDSNKGIIIAWVGINCILMNLRTFLQMVLQSTNRILAFSRNLIFEKLLFVLLVGLVIIFGKHEFEYLILADVIAKTLMLIMLCYTCKDMVFTKTGNFSKTVSEAGLNISIGINLVVANIAGMLIVGTTRLFIEHGWDIETFGKISLTLTIANLVMVFIGAASIVLFPIIKRANPELLIKIYSTLRTLLMAIVLGALILYYPVSYIFSNWLPSYKDTLIYMVFLFPVCVYEAKMSMLISTYLKALRKERYILIINIFAVALSVLCSFIAAILLRNLTLAVFTIVTTLAIRAIIAEIALSKLLNIRVIADIILETVMTVAFICIGWYIGGVAGLVLYLIFYAVYLSIKTKEIKKAFILLRGSPS